MKLRGYTKYWIVALALWESITVFVEMLAKGSYLGQTPSGPVARVFAPGLIC